MLFNAMLDSLFMSELAVDALYVPAAGEPKPVRAVRKSPDVALDYGPAEIVAETTLLEIRVSEIPDPRAGDTIEMGAGGPAAEGFIVQGKPTRRDPDRRIWTLDVRPR